MGICYISACEPINDDYAIFRKQNLVPFKIRNLNQVLLDPRYHNFRVMVHILCILYTAHLRNSILTRIYYREQIQGSRKIKEWCISVLSMYFIEFHAMINIACSWETYFPWHSCISKRDSHVDNMTYDWPWNMKKLHWNIENATTTLLSRWFWVWHNKHFYIVFLIESVIFF